MPRSGDMMLGRRGTFVLPVSEADAITAAIAHITHGEYREAITTLKLLKEQVSQGYHANPYKPFVINGEIGKDVHDIRYQHAEDGKFYKHDFAGEVKVLAITRNGKRELLLVHKRGLPLWDDF